MTTALTKIDFVRVSMAGDVFLHANGRDLPLLREDCDRAASVQSSVRTYLRRGVAVLDEFGWTSMPTATGIQLLSGHDQEFIFAREADLKAFLAEQEAINASLADV